VWDNDAFDRAPLGGRLTRSKSLNRKLEPGRGERQSLLSDDEDDLMSPGIN